MELSYQSSENKRYVDLYKQLKELAGTHAPSVSAWNAAAPDHPIQVDACFLSNPYATELYAQYLSNELGKPGKLRTLLEAYPAQGNDLAASIGAGLGVDPDRLFIGNGANEVIQALLQHTISYPLMMPLPTYSAYYEMATGPVLFHHLDKDNGYELDVGAFIADVQLRNPATVVLINPNNPNGAYLRLDQVTTIVEAIHDIVDDIIIDESFLHFTEIDGPEGPGSIPSHMPLLRFPKVSIVKSLSKDYGIAGLRLGYGILNPDRVRKLRSIGYLWNVNGFGELFVKCFADKQFQTEYNNARIEYIHDTRELFRQVNKIQGLKTYPSRSNFALVELDPELHGAVEEIIPELIYQSGVYLRGCSDKAGLKGKVLRYSARTRLENTEILKALQSLEIPSANQIRSMEQAAR